MRSDPRQMVLDLFPEDRPRIRSALETCMESLLEAGCDEQRVRPMAEFLFSRFGNVEGLDRAHCLAYFYGTGRHAVPRLQACPPALIGLYDEGLDYHTIWDRCWAARWIPLQEALEVMEWHYNYRKPYTGAPEWIWYTDNGGREIKRPYKEGS